VQPALARHGRWQAPYDAGAVGDRFLTELTGAARRGVHVRVLAEAYGSDTFRQDYFAPLIATGGEAQATHPAPSLTAHARQDGGATR
jgi:phosphatidylserine/phosphatidylglycerophosphate/cardiolipin synthase-like enzyme